MDTVQQKKLRIIGAIIQLLRSLESSGRIACQAKRELLADLRRLRRRL